MISVSDYMKFSDRDNIAFTRSGSEHSGSVEDHVVIQVSSYLFGGCELFDDGIVRFKTYDETANFRLFSVATYEGVKRYDVHRFVVDNLRTCEGILDAFDDAHVVFAFLIRGWFERTATRGLFRDLFALPNGVRFVRVGSTSLDFGS